MIKELLATSDVLSLPIVTMLFFLGVFAIVIWVSLSRKRTGHYRAMSDLPLNDDVQEVR